MKSLYNNTWIYVIFVLTPILNTYSFGLGDLAILSNLFVAFYGISKGYFFKYPKLLSCLCATVILHEILFYLFFNGEQYSYWRNSIIGMTIYALAIMTYIHTLKLAELYKWWKIAGVVYMIGLYYHAIIYYGLGQNCDLLKIPFLPTTTNEAFEKILSIDYIRPRSFFTEPSHYATFMLPLLYLNMLYKDKKYGAINIISIFLSTSTLGIVVSMYFYFMFNLWNSSWRNKLIYICGAIILYYAFIYLPLFEYAKEKILSSDGSDASSSLRLFFTAHVWAELPWNIKMTGIAAPSIADFLTKNSQYIPRDLLWVLDDNSSISYASSAWYVAVRYGLVIWGLYLYMYIKNIMTSFKSPVIYYAISILIVTFVQSCFMNPIFIIQIVLMYVLIANIININERVYNNNFIRK